MQKCMHGYPWYLRKLSVWTRGNSLGLFQNTVLSMQNLIGKGSKVIWSARVTIFKT